MLKTEISAYLSQSVMSVKRVTKWSRHVNGEHHLNIKIPLSCWDNPGVAAAPSVHTRDQHYMTRKSGCVTVSQS